MSQEYNPFEPSSWVMLRSNEPLTVGWSHTLKHLLPKAEDLAAIEARMLASATRWLDDHYFDTMPFRVEFAPINIFNLETLEHAKALIFVDRSLYAYHRRYRGVPL